MDMKYTGHCYYDWKFSMPKVNGHIPGCLYTEVYEDNQYHTCNPRHQETTGKYVIPDTIIGSSFYPVSQIGEVGE